MSRTWFRAVVRYPLEARHIVLPTDRDWNANLEPVGMPQAGTFELETAQKRFFLDADLRLIAGSIPERD